MSDNYKDICETNPITSEENQTAIAAASSIPWQIIEQDPGDLRAEAIDGLSDDFAQAGANASPELEINKGKILFSSRRVYLQPQQNVFAGSNSLDAIRRETRNIIGSNALRPYIGLPPLDPVEYGDDPIATSVNLLDPLRFILGKVFYSRPVTGMIFVEEEQNLGPFDPLIHPIVSPFRVYNNADYEPGNPVSSNNSLGLYFAAAEVLSIGTDGSDEYIITQKVKLNSYAPLFIDDLEDPTTKEADEFLLRYLPSRGHVFEEFRFSTDASLFESEASFVSGPPGIYASFSVNLPKILSQRAAPQTNPELPAGQPQSDYYETNSMDRGEKLNVYVDYLNTHPDTIIDDLQGNPLVRPDTIEETCYEEVVSEKYPSHAVRRLKPLNDSILEATVGDAQTGEMIRWIDSVSPEFVEILFNTPSTVNNAPDFAQIFEQTGTDALLLAALDARFSKIQDELSLFSDLTALSLSSISFDDEVTTDDYYRVPDNENPVRQVSRQFQSPNQKYIANYRPRVISNSITFMKDLIESATPELSPSPDEENLPISEIFKRSEFPMLFDLHEKLDSTALRQNMKIELMSRVARCQAAIGRILSDDQDKRPKKILDLFSPKNCYSEVIAFRVEKVNALTGKVIKEFYFFNESESEKIRFIDSEVTLSSRYIYNIYAINMVCSTNYLYRSASANSEDLEDRDTTNFNQTVIPQPSIEFEFESTLDLKIIETPYFSQDVVVTDLPPLDPRLELEKLDHHGDNSLGGFRIRFYPNLGTASEIPMKIREEDEQAINRMLENQPNRSTREKQQGIIKYSGIDTNPICYEMLVLKSPPQQYSDFDSAESRKTDTGSSILKFRLEPNSPRFLIFRTLDSGGLSNPSRMFKLVYHSYADGDYYEFELYEPEIIQSALEMTCERYLSIKPAFHQSIVDYGITDESTQADIVSTLESAPSLEEISIGTAPATERIWDKKFKIRIKSVNTGKAIDLNLVHKVLSDSPSTASGPQRAGATCTGEVNEKNEAINRGIQKSKSDLREKAAQILRSSSGLSASDESDPRNSGRAIQNRDNNNSPGNGFNEY